MVGETTGLRKLREAALASVLAPGPAIERLAAAHKILATIDITIEVPARLRRDLETLIKDIEAILSQPPGDQTSVRGGHAEAVIERLHRLYSIFRGTSHA